MPQAESTPCPCGSGQALEACCAPYVGGALFAPSAEALMRARYTAYALQAVEFLQNTHLPRPNREEIALWAETATFTGLEVIATSGGGPSDETGTVEFLARYREGDADRVHHERSRFGRRDGRWYYLDPEEKVAVPRVGRNEPCPCGSGKKFKKCHATGAS